MKMRDIAGAIGFVAIGCVLTAAAAGGARGGDSRPMVVQKGVTINTVDRSSGATNPISYEVEEADGPWIKVVLLKKSKTRKGDPFWVKIDDLGAFVVE